MSEMGHLQTFDEPNRMSALPPKADIRVSHRHELTFAKAQTTLAVNRKLGSKLNSRRALSVDRYPFGSAML